MVTFRSKTFVRIQYVAFAIAAIASFTTVTRTNPGGGFLMLFFCCGVLYGLAKKHNWVIGALRLWGLLILPSSIIGGAMLVLSLDRGWLESLLAILAVMPMAIWGFSCFFLTPKYIAAEQEQVQSPRKQNESAA